jgi:hypothetical protein
MSAEISSYIEGQYQESLIQNLQDSLRLDCTQLNTGRSERGFGLGGEDLVQGLSPINPLHLYDVNQKGSILG